MRHELRSFAIAQSFSAAAVGIMAAFPPVGHYAPMPDRMWIGGNIGSIQGGEDSSASEINALITPWSAGELDFTAELADIFEKFVASQKPLDGDIATIISKNLWDLYAT